MRDWNGSRGEHSRQEQQRPTRVRGTEGVAEPERKPQGPEPAGLEERLGELMEPGPWRDSDFVLGAAGLGGRCGCGGGEEGGAWLLQAWVQYPVHKKGREGGKLDRKLQVGWVARARATPGDVENLGLV